MCCGEGQGVQKGGEDKGEVTRKDWVWCKGVWAYQNDISQRCKDMGRRLFILLSSLPFILLL